MKRVLFALSLLLAISGIMQAQQGIYNQTGLATQEMQANGFVAGHANFPVGSKARITNTSNGKEIEVTIVRKIQPSVSRVIDLSPEAAMSLGFGLGRGGYVHIRVYQIPPRQNAELPPEPPPAPQPVQSPVPPPPIPVAEPEPRHAAEAAPEPEFFTAVMPEPVPEPQPPAQALVPPASENPQPVLITINNYITNADEAGKAMHNVAGTAMHERPIRTNRLTGESDPVQEPAATIQEALSPAQLAAIAQAVAMAQAAAIEQAQLAPLTQPAAAQAPNPMAEDPMPLYRDTPVTDVLVIPDLPNPSSDKTYRLITGNYISEGNASKVRQYLLASGFSARQEYVNGAYRVFAADIPASSVYHAVLRMGAIGFAQIEIQE